MNIIDTHSHLYLDAFDTDRVEMLARARDAGVGRILMPAIDQTTHARMLETESLYPPCESMMGLHPCSVKENYKEELAIVSRFLEERPFVAVGEIGLDFYWDKTFIKDQYAAFEEQVRWALHYDVPIVIHSRESLDECIGVVGKYQDGNLGGVFHCFSGTEDQARQIMDLGFYLGIGGVVTFKKSGLDSVIRHIGLSRVVLETDAPYLAPVPFRGKRNESSYLTYVIGKIADTLEISAEEVANTTTENAQKLFGH